MFDLVFCLLLDELDKFKRDWWDLGRGFCWFCWFCVCTSLSWRWFEQMRWMDSQNKPLQSSAQFLKELNVLGMEVSFSPTVFTFKNPKNARKERKRVKFHSHLWVFEKIFFSKNTRTETKGSQWISFFKLQKPSQKREQSKKGTKSK